MKILRLYGFMVILPKMKGQRNSSGLCGVGDSNLQQKLSRHSCEDSAIIYGRFLQCMPSVLTPSYKITTLRYAIYSEPPPAKRLIVLTQECKLTLLIFRCCNVSTKCFRVCSVHTCVIKIGHWTCEIEMGHAIVQVRAATLLHPSYYSRNPQWQCCGVSPVVYNLVLRRFTLAQNLYYKNGLQCGFW